MMTMIDDKKRKQHQQSQHQPQRRLRRQYHSSYHSSKSMIQMLWMKCAVVVTIMACTSLLCHDGGNDGGDNNHGRIGLFGSTYFLLSLYHPCEALPFTSSMRRKKEEEEEKEKKDEKEYNDDGHEKKEEVIRMTRNDSELESSTTASTSSTVSVVVPKSIRGSIGGGASANTNPLIDRFFQIDDTHTDSSDSSDSNSISQLVYQEIYQQTTNSSELTQFLTTTRRALHKHPELMYQEEHTSQTIQSILKQLHVPYTTGWAKNKHTSHFKGPGGYGIVADIGSHHNSPNNKKKPPCLILRADMDALPIHEQTHISNTYKSDQEGKMHACGHDGHVTMLLGALTVLKKMEHSLQGTIRFVFQPAEEGGAGMKRMIHDEHLLQMEPQPSIGYGMHVWPTLPSGTIASRPGPLMAAAEQFEIRLEGKGGHAAMPHLVIDPIVVASSIVSSLQTIVSRTISPLDAGVVSVTYLQAGDGAYNVIPSHAILRGTIRSLSTRNLLNWRDRVEHVSRSIANLHGCNMTIEYSPDYYPPTVNDPWLFRFSSQIAKEVSRWHNHPHDDDDNNGMKRSGDVGDGSQSSSGSSSSSSSSKTPPLFLSDIEPTMGGEDFAFLAEQIPSTFFFIGQGSGGDHLDTTHIGEDRDSSSSDSDSEDHNNTNTSTNNGYAPRTDFGLHHPSFALDESIMPLGVALHVNLALRTLKQLALDEEETNWDQKILSQGRQSSQSHSSDALTEETLVSEL